jgi:hypothetical protein
MHGVIHMEGKVPILETKLAIGNWPPGRYVIDIDGNPFFGYCTIDFVD